MIVLLFQNDTVHFIWAISPKDPKNASDIVKHADNNRGTKSVLLLDPNPHETAQIPPGAMTFDLVVEKVIAFVSFGI